MNSSLKIGILATSGIVALSAGIALALNFTNPFTKIGETNLGFQTKAQIAETLHTHVETTPVTVDVNGEPTETVLGDLGVTVSEEDLNAAAEAVFTQKALWKIGEWSTETTPDVKITVQEQKLNAFIEAAGLNPTQSAYVIEEKGKYVTIPVTVGHTIDKETLIAETEKQVLEGEKLSFAVVEQAPEITNEQATEFAGKLNTLTSDLHLKANKEQVKPKISEPLFIVSEPGAKLSYEVNPESIKTIAGQAPDLINRQGVANENQVNSKNEILYTTFKGTTGRELTDDPDTVQQKLTTALEEGNPAVELAVKETKPEDVNTFRRIEVDLTNQTTTLYENNKVVKKYDVSSGLPATPTNPGDFTVRAFVPMQDMGCVAGYDYCTKDIPWVVYFDGNIAFHGAYWHNNFGNRMSHGCVNLPVSEAKFVYEFAYIGTEVKVLP